MKKLVLLISLAFLSSCKQEKEPDINNNEDKVETFNQEIETTNQEVVLVPEAREQVVQWVNYITAQNEINNLREATVSEVIEISGPLAQIMQALQNSVPDTLQSTAVEARLNVLTTKAKVLQQLSSQRNLKAEEIAKTAGDIPVEFNNFKLQLNEIFLKSLEDFERELDEFEQNENQILNNDSL